jgi:hypothetical protein
MSKYQGLINRALKNGFDLSTLPNYNEVKFKQRLYDYFIEKKYFVMEEGESFFISYNVATDVAEISIMDDTLLITPLEEEGFFDVFMEVMRFITEECEMPSIDEDENTESYSEETLKKVLDEDDDDSEEMWI